MDRLMAKPATKELLKKVRKIQIASRKVVDELLGGEYKSVFKGRGMEFDEVREYQPGDEVRTIDWNVTARTGKPFVKRFIEEREQLLFFVIDLSGSGNFGTAGITKNEMAAELCGLLAFSAIQNNDRVGLLVFTDEVELFIPPDKGEMHALYIIREILGFKPRRRGTSISTALKYLNKMIKRRCILFLISDFLDSHYETTLRHTAHRHDLIAVTLTDPHELQLPSAGLVELLDSETGETRLIDTASSAARAHFKKVVAAQKEETKMLFNQLRIDQINLRTDQNYLQDLIQFFKSRERGLIR